MLCTGLKRHSKKHAMSGLFHMSPNGERSRTLLLLKPLFFGSRKTLSSGTRLSTTTASSSLVTLRRVSMRQRSILFLIVAGIGLCAAAADRRGDVAGDAETEYAERHDFSPGYTPGYDAHMSSYYYPASGDHKHRKGDYEYRRDTYDEHEHDRHYGHEPTDELLPNELTPDGKLPKHLKLRLLGTPVGHVMNMSVPSGNSKSERLSEDERHAPVMKMYDAWCEVPRDPAYGEAVPVPHLGHLHVTYKPAHHQRPWRLWGQTMLNIGKISEFTLAHLDDDNDQSVCATFFNADTVITPLNEPPIYNYLIKPKYPVNMMYVLDGMRPYPIPAQLTSRRYDSDNGEASYYYSSKAGKSDPIKVVTEEPEECRIAQLIWGKFRIATKVNGEDMVYEGTLKAIPDLDEAGAMHRMESQSNKIMQAMCGDKAVPEEVPWIWEFDLNRV